MSTADAVHRDAWDGAPSSPQQERFYRELMSADRLPSPTELAQKMLAAVERDDVSASQLTALISRDPVVSAHLLRMANSAFIGIRSRVTSITHAVTLLGFARVRDIVIGLSVWGRFGGKGPGAAYRKAMWLHSAMVAAATKKLVERAGGDGGTAFAAGLLHDVGKLVLGLRLGETYWSMLEEATARGENAAVVESEAFGCHHGTIGGWLLQLWQLPSALVDPVALHHEVIAANDADIVRAVAVVDRLLTATDRASGRRSRTSSASRGSLVTPRAVPTMQPRRGVAMRGRPACLCVLLACAGSRPVLVPAQEVDLGNLPRIVTLTGSCSVTVAPDRAVIVGGIAAGAMLPLPAVEQLDKQLVAIRGVVEEHHGTLELLERVRTVKPPSPGTREAELPFEVVQRLQATFPAKASVDTILQRMIEIGLDRFGDAVLSTDGSNRQTVVRYRMTDLDARLDALRERCAADAWKTWCASPAAAGSCPTDSPPDDLELQSLYVRSAERVLRPDGGVGYWEFTISPTQRRPRAFELLGNVPVHLTGSIVLVRRVEGPR